MITILHGDNDSALHLDLFARLKAAKEKGIDVIRLDGKKIEVSSLETAIGTDALFAIAKLVVIDGLLSLPKGQHKNGLIDWITTHDAVDVNLILIEKKVLTAAQLKAFPKAKAVIFKLPAVLFQWLETFGTLPPDQALELFHQVLAREDVQLAFIMLIRQVRTLLAFAADGSYDGPPFLRGKVASQARFFSKEKLLALHSRLLIIDSEQKTGKDSLSLVQNLDLLLVSL